MENIKKWLISLLIALIITAVIIVLAPEEEKVFDKSQAPEILETVITEYCLDLESKAIYPSCPTCRYFVTSQEVNGTRIKHPDYNLKDSFLYVENMSTNNPRFHEYTIKEEGGNYIMDIKVNNIYGSNTRTGTSLLTIRLDRMGNILSKKIPKKGCL